MSSIVDALYELKYNPFEYGEYLASFYTALGESDNNFLLAPLVISICSHPFFSIKLNGANTKSTIWTIFGGHTKLNTEKNIEKFGAFALKPLQRKIVHKEQLYDLQERIDGFQTLTEQCIQYCLVNDWLSLDEETLALRSCDETDSMFTKQKNAEKLGLLFSNHSVVEIYALLGVKPR